MENYLDIVEWIYILTEKGEEEDSSADIWMQKLKSINVEMETKLKLKFDLLKAK